MVTARACWSEVPDESPVVDRSGAVGGGAAPVAVVDDAAPQAPAGHLADHRAGHRGDGGTVPRSPGMAIPNVFARHDDPVRTVDDLLVVGGGLAARVSRSRLRNVGLGSPRLL